MIVPGSPLMGKNHPFAWYAIVRDRKTGKQSTYWINGSQQTREQVAEFLATFYRGVEVVTIDRGNAAAFPMGILKPIPRHHFQLGVFDAIERELAGPEQPLLIARHRISTKLLPRSRGLIGR